MSQPAHRPSVRILQAAMMAQIVLGLARFLAPLVGWDMPGAIWRVHAVLAISIAVAVMVVLRRRPGMTPTTLWRIARFAPLAPLTLGLAIWLGLRLGPWLVPLHMVAGLTALGYVDNALKRLLAGPPLTARPHDVKHPART